MVLVAKVAGAEKEAREVDQAVASSAGQVARAVGVDKAAQVVVAADQNRCCEYCLCLLP